MAIRQSHPKATSLEFVDGYDLPKSVEVVMSEPYVIGLGDYQKVCEAMKKAHYHDGVTPCLKEHK